MRAVIFDFDGLIVDSEYTMAVGAIEVLARRGVVLTIGDIGHLFGSTENDHLWEALLLERCGGVLSLDELVEELTHALPGQMDALPLMPGVIEVIDRAAHAGWAVGLATGQDRPRLNEHLARHCLTERFDAIVTAADVPHGKPAPDIYLETARRLGVEAGDCLVLEDSLPGCEAALAAGMSVVACPSRVTEHCEFPAAVRQVASLLELADAALWPGTVA